MTGSQHNRGSAPVGVITDLDSTEAASVMYLRLWCGGDAAQSQICADFTKGLGPDHGHRAFQAFRELCTLCARHGRRPLMRHSIRCKCIGADESCFANFITTATEGAREDALLIATLLVRADMAPLIAALASDVGLALKRMHLASPRDTPRTPQSPHIFH